MDYTTDNQAPKPDAGRAASDKDLVRKLEQQWQEARKASVGWRKDAREDRAFYFGRQWTSEEKNALEDQGRPAIVINQIFKSLNNLIGRERDNRLDWRALPRGASDVQAADAITKGLAFVDDQTRAKYAVSAAAKDAWLGPVGWLEVGIDDSNPANEPFYVREESWENMWHDPHGRKLDLSDCRYLIRSKLFDYDLTIAAYPKAAEALKNAIAQDKDEAEQKGAARFSDGDDYGNRSGADTIYEADTGWCDHERQRVRLREHWWWENVSVNFWVYPDGRVTEADTEDMAQAIDAYQQGGVLTEGVKKRYKYAVIAGKTILAQGESPYPFERFPFVAVWSYVDEKGRPFGVVRMQKDPQRELNVARARVNESQRSRWAIVEKGKMTPRELAQFAENLARSNFVQEVTQAGHIQMGSDKADVASWMGLMETSRREVDEVAGQNEAAYGDKSNEKSGKAIQARVAQQGLNMAELFDNLRYARLQVGEMLLSMMQAFCEPAKLQRIVEASIIRENPKEDLTWLGQAFANPIEQMRFDIVIDDQAETSTERQAAMEQAVQLLQMAGPAAPALIPDVIRMSDFPGKEDMALKFEQAMAPPPPPPMPPQAPQVMPDGALPLEMPPEAMPPMV